MEAIWLPLDWGDPDARERQLVQIEQRIDACRSASPENRLTIVWSAGRVGFGADRHDANIELANFEAVLAFALRCTREYRAGEARMVHFSSAGGLFEGQRQVGSESIPRPRRPYGELKESEERLLLASPIPSVIVRLSSVYGHLAHGRRAGLISILLVNGICREVSSIVGTMNTLRDFIWAPDVGAAVSRLILDPISSEDRRTVLLASGRPSSIFEVQKIIEDLLGYKIYISYAPKAWNSDDITFAPSDLPSGWISTDLRTNIGAVYRQAIRGGVPWTMAGCRPA
jgi:UDP-glucose 4-epimerase